MCEGFLVSFYFKVMTVQILVVLFNPKNVSECLLVKVRIVTLGFENVREAKPTDPSGMRWERIAPSPYGDASHSRSSGN